MIFSEAFWRLTRGFTDDLEAVNDCKKRTAVTLQIRG